MKVKVYEQGCLILAANFNSRKANVDVFPAIYDIPIDFVISLPKIILVGIYDKPAKI